MSVEALNKSIATLAVNVAAKLAGEQADIAAAVAAATVNTVPQADVDAAQAAVDTINATVAPKV